MATKKADNGAQWVIDGRLCETLGSGIARARVARGETVRGLAKGMGVSPSDVSRWERDITIPRADRMALLASYWRSEIRLLP